MAVWGVHFPGPRSSFVATGAMVLIRPGIRDLSLIGNNRSEVKRDLEASYPSEVGKAVPTWAGVLLRFAFGPEIGDAVVHPQKASGTVSLGTIESDYYWQSPDQHCRRVSWQVTGLRRDLFSVTAQKEFASRPAFFEVRKSAAEVTKTLAHHERTL